MAARPDTEHDSTQPTGPDRRAPRGWNLAGQDDHDWRRGLRYQALSIALDVDDLGALIHRADTATDDDLAPLVARELTRQLGPLAVRIAHQLAVDTLAPALQEPRIPLDDATITVRDLHALLGRLLEVLEPDQQRGAA